MSEVALELFREPVLGNLLTASAAEIHGHVTSVLCWIVQYEWFNSEFIGNGGFDWLEQRIASNQCSRDFARLVVYAMDRAQSFTELAQWASCLRRCLMMRLNNLTLLRTDIWGDFTYKLRSVLSGQRELRALDSSTITPSAQVSYIKALSDVEWNQWQDYMEALVKGVEEGYVVDTDPRFLRDPDSICGRR
jgi:hypothetical protein